MNPGRRAFLTDMVARCEERAALRRAGGTRADLVVSPEPERITWASPCFHAGGSFDPFAGTWSERMLASADACERVGAFDAARAYREHAARGTPPEVDEESASPLTAQRQPNAGTRKPPRSTWTGAPLPPPEPVPFVAGEQIGFTL